MKENKKHDKEKNENQVTKKELVQDQIPNTPTKHPDILKEWRPEKTMLSEMSMEI